MNKPILHNPMLKLSDYNSLDEFIEDNFRSRREINSEEQSLVNIVKDIDYTKSENSIH